MTTPPVVTADPWQKLRQTTSARIALGRAGGSLPTHEWLVFKAAHAAARDAVHNSFDSERLAEQVRGLGAETIIVDSAAPDRLTYLQRPDLGRRLSDASRYALQEMVSSTESPELVLLISDGLSALAVERQAPELLAALLPLLAKDNWRIGPIVIARFGRVALQDEVGVIFGGQLALTLIGERPGLGSADSLGGYLVYGPRPGNTDANRNCVSNIRAEGLPCDKAATTIHYLLSEARRRRLSGVQLKDQRTLTTVESKLALGNEDHAQPE